MTQEEKAKAYDEAIERAKKLQKTCYSTTVVGWCEYIFPQLKESKDEKIRKMLINHITQERGSLTNNEAEDALAWLEKQGTSYTKKDVDDAYVEGMAFAKDELEKQGEQTSVDKIEPKFKVGDWIISNNKKSIYQVIEVKRGIYVIRDNADNYEYHIGIEECEKSGKFFTIQDAKDGDVLALDGIKGGVILMFRGIGNTRWDDVIDYYCYYDFYRKKFAVQEDLEYWGDIVNNQLKPATKEQCDTLFAKMKEAGYEWDSETKELKKIEQKPTNENPTDVGHEYYSELLNNDDSDTIDEYAYQCAYCMSHDWMKESATWEDVQKAVKLGAKWQKQKPAWSEEDECYMTECINAIATKDGWSFEEKRKTKHWLKSLKERVQPKNHWKPSDRQMHAFEQVYDWYNNNFAPSETLTSLYNDLKKLKEKEV